MENEAPYIYGIFVEELKNRFLCLVKIDGVETVCYIPSSCHLGNFLNLVGKTVLLKPTTTPNARTQYAVYAVKYGKSFITVNLSESNAVVANSINKRYFSFLGKRNNVLREYKIDNYRADIFIQNSKTIVEVKGLLSVEKSAKFPTVYSERAITQLNKIAELIVSGYKAVFIIVSHGYGVKNIKINADDTDFYAAFSNCVQLGMQYRAYQAKLKNGKLEIIKEIPLLFS